MREESMPLGNGRLGVGVWSQDGYTAQINRQDTLPKRLSPGQIVLPGLNKLASAADYHGRLDLYNGEFVESGGGVRATALGGDSWGCVFSEGKKGSSVAAQKAETNI